jgi:uncharacterized protein YbaP (TraB family)
MIKDLMTKTAGVALGLAALGVAFLTPLPCLAQAQTQPAPAAKEAGHPLMWVVHGQEGTLYLLGSFHLLPPSADWEDSRIDAALNAADHVWFELTGFDDQAQAMQAFSKYGVYPTAELSQHLDAETNTHLSAALTRHGLTLDAVQHFKPWAVAIVLAQKELADGGFESGQGVDLTLYHKALAARKDVQGFETMDMQIGMMAHLDNNDGASLLKETLKDDDDGPAKMAEMAHAWLHGDEPALVKDSITEMQAEDADLYKHMLVERNISWEPRIDDMIRGAKAGGTSLVVVGAGHLIGPDGIVAHLRAEGFKVEPVR